MWIVNNCVRRVYLQNAIPLNQILPSVTLHEYYSSGKLETGIEKIAIPII